MMGLKNIDNALRPNDKKQSKKKKDVRHEGWQLPIFGFSVSDHLLDSPTFNFGQDKSEIDSEGDQKAFDKLSSR